MEVEVRPALHSPPLLLKTEVQVSASRLSEPTAVEQRGVKTSSLCKKQSFIALKITYKSERRLRVVERQSFFVQ